MNSIIKLSALAFVAAFFTIMMTGCSDALTNISESVKEKNIAAGSDTAGGNIELASKAENAWIPNIELWFGRRRVWYVSLKKDADVSKMPDIIKAGNSELGIKAGTDGIGISDGAK